MLVPLRRSLGGLAIEATLRCTTCARSLHTHAKLHYSAAGAAAQADVHCAPPQWAQRQKDPAGLASLTQRQQRQQQQQQQPSKKSKKRENSESASSAATRSSSQKPPAKATVDLSNVKSVARRKKVFAKSMPQEELNREAVDIDSQYHFGEEDVLRFYQLPPESEFPEVMRLGSNAGRRTGEGKEFMWKAQAYQFLNDGLHIKIKLAEESITLPNKSKGVRVRLTGHWGQNKALAIGDGKDKVISSRSVISNIQREAARTAALHFILREYQSAVIREPVIAATTMSLKGADEFKLHESAKVDVYNYAAQMNVLPHFETTQLSSSGNANAKTGYRVRVTVEGTIVKGEGYHSHIRAYAEIAACVEFKRMAECMHQGERMLVKDINTLTSQTGKKFLEYCKMKQKDWEMYEFKCKQGQGMEFRGALYLGDRLLSESLMYKCGSLRKSCLILIANPMRRQSVITSRHET